MIRKSFLGILLACCLFASSCEDDPIIIDETPFELPEIVKVYNDILNDVPIVVLGSRDREFIATYERTIDGAVLDFEAVQGQEPVVMKDNLGNLYDIFGKKVGNSDRLKPTLSSTGYWFSWSSMYPGTEIYGEHTEPVNVDENFSDIWDLDQQLVFSGAIFDAIQGLESPEFIEYDEKEGLNSGFYIQDEDHVVAVEINGEMKVYPHNMLYRHEIVNDEVGGEKIALIFCPLTGTAMVWGRIIEEEEDLFGISGLLYNNNILVFDRKTNSIWSQLKGVSVFGDRKRTEAKLYASIETTWGSLKEMFDSPKVMTTNTGYGWDYSKYPYGNYREDHSNLSYPLLYSDDRMPNKKRVHGVAVDDVARVYKFEDF